MLTASTARALVADARASRDEVVCLTRELIGIPSESSRESAIALRVSEVLTGIGYDEVRIDEVGNVLARIKGGGRGPSFMLNGHLDHVPPGSMPDPYEGKVVSGSQFGTEGDVVYGRGAVDMKGALAAMIVSGALLKRRGLIPPGDFTLTFVVGEEIGGVGTKHLVSSGIRADVVVVAEPSRLQIAIGHRGAAYARIHVQGRAAHVSMPHLGINAMYKACRVIDGIQALERTLPDDPFLGRMTMTACNMRLVPGADNVVPEEATVTLSARVTPGYTQEILVQALQGIINGAAKDDPEFQATLEIDRYKGAFYASPGHPHVAAARAGVEEYLGYEPALIRWQASTDAPFLAGIPGATVIGFGPGREDFAHTEQDHVSVDDLVAATAAYALFPFLLGQDLSLAPPIVTGCAECR